MPKRPRDNNLDYIVKKLRKLEKEVKRSRCERNRLSTISSSSSTSTSSSSDSSRPATPNLHILENQNDQETSVAQDVDVETIDLEPTPTTTNDVTQTIMPIFSSNSTEEICPTGQEETIASDELVNILGVDPSVIVEYGKEINKDLATRFSHISTCGLNKDSRKELIKKYLVPANCLNIGAPMLNAEIKGALIEARQKQMAAGIAALGKLISDQLSSKDKNNSLIMDLMDIGRIFCDIQHSESEARRNFALYSVKKELKDQLSTTKIDKYLFGNNLLDTLKTAKAVSKSTSDLKPEAPKKPKPTTSSSGLPKPLNWKARTPARRQPTGPPVRPQPPAMQNALPRGNSSNVYTSRHKQARRS